MLDLSVRPKPVAYRYTQMLSKPSYRQGSRYPEPWMAICIHPCNLDSGSPCRNDVLLGVCITMRACRRSG